MVFLASILESYEILVGGKVGNPNMTKEDYDQIDLEEMELINIRWCMASIMRGAQKFMEITGRSCLGPADTELGFDKSKVTCFKCKQKGHFKRECANQQSDEAVNPFRDDYYQKAIYHHISEPPKVNQKQTGESSSKIRQQATAVIHEDGGFNWSKYISREGHALVAEVEVDKRWQRDFARHEIEKLYVPFKEAHRANRWDDERECYLDPQGNPVVDPKKVDFNAATRSFQPVKRSIRGGR
ncbi:putative transcription factor interactor and regulator CCHC(Zn) family [Helianthus annuus]|nr:putative transcription factor interactor and regulator CCHC(Zn) family [Helianthus annuus]